MQGASGEGFDAFLYPGLPPDGELKLDCFGFLAFLGGLLFSWPSYNVNNFASNSTVLAEPMNLVHISMLGSLMTIGSIVVTPIICYSNDRIGRKCTLVAVGLFYVIAWSLIAMTKTIPWILTSVTIAGFGSSGQTLCVIYISEIVQDSIRGAMTSSVIVVFYSAVLVSYIIGGYLTYYQVIYLQLSLSVINVVLALFFKESPIYLLSKGKEKEVQGRFIRREYWKLFIKKKWRNEVGDEFVILVGLHSAKYAEAAESLAFYRQRSPDSKYIVNELQKLKLQLSQGPEEKDAVATKTLLPGAEPKKISEWQFLRNSTSSKRALMVCIVMMNTMMLMGNMPIQVYAEILYIKSAPSFDANLCTVWLAVDYVVAAIVCTIIIDRVGRKPLAIVSCAASGICMLILGTLVQFNYASEWVFVIVMIIYNFFFTVGMALIPYILIGELFLPEVRSLCSSITTTIGCTLNFFVILIFNPIIEHYGFASLFYGFTVVSFAGAYYSFHYLPETKGRSVDAIQNLFLKKGKKNITADQQSSKA